jgi:AraC family transcriptional regulator
MDEPNETTATACAAGAAVETREIPFPAQFTADALTLEFDRPNVAAPLRRVVRRDGFRAECLSLPEHEAHRFAWTGPVHLFSLLRLRQDAGARFADGVKPIDRGDLSGSLSFIPAGSRLWGWSVPSAGVHSITSLYFDPEALPASIGARFRALEPRPMPCFSEDGLRTSMIKLQAALSSSDGTDGLYVDTLCLFVALELGRHLERLAARDAPPVGGLSRLHQRRVVDFVEANLSADIGLTELAGITGLSRFHFVRSFKKSTGVAPYHYLLRRRVERAQALLREGGLSMAEISRTVGFKSAARFNRAFRRICGAPPSTFRAQEQRPTER